MIGIDVSDLTQVIGNKLSNPKTCVLKDYEKSVHLHTTSLTKIIAFYVLKYMNGNRIE